MRNDAISNIAVVSALSPAVQAASINGAAIDRKGYGGVAIIVSTGAIASAGDFGVKLQHSDTSTSGDFVDAPAADVKSNAPATLDADSAYKLGYIGKKRFVRLAVSKAGGTSIAAGAAAVLTLPHIAPVA